jgi:ribosomal protein S1
MIEVGSVIRSPVHRIEPYGLYFRHGDDSVLVLAPEVSWTGKGDLHDRVQVGDEFDILVLRMNYQSGEYVGSIRRLHKEENPYRQLARLPRGARLHGTLALVGKHDALVKLPHDVRGCLRAGQLPAASKPGDPIEVEISALDVDEGKLEVVPARDRPSTLAGLAANSLTPSLSTR